MPLAPTIPVTDEVSDNAELLSALIKCTDEAPVSVKATVAEFITTVSFKNFEPFIGSLVLFYFL